MPNSFHAATANHASAALTGLTFVVTRMLGTGLSLLPGVEVNAWDIAKSLIVTMLMPIVLGLMARSHSPEDAQQWAPLSLIPTAHLLGKRNSA